MAEQNTMAEIRAVSERLTSISNRINEIQQNQRQFQEECLRTITMMQEEWKSFKESRNSERTENRERSEERQRIDRFFLNSGTMDSIPVVNEDSICSEGLENGYSEMLDDRDLYSPLPTNGFAAVSNGNGLHKRVATKLTPRKRASGVRDFPPNCRRNTLRNGTEENGESLMEKEKTNAQKITGEDGLVWWDHELEKVAAKDGKGKRTKITARKSVNVNALNVKKPAGSESGSEGVGRLVIWDKDRSLENDSHNESGDAVIRQKVQEALRRFQREFSRLSDEMKAKQKEGISNGKLILK